MIKKLRIQIISSIVFVFSLLLIFILVSTWLSTKKTLEDSCMSTLNSAIHTTYSSNAVLQADSSIPLLVVTVDYQNNIRLLLNDMDEFSYTEITNLVKEVLDLKSQTGIIEDHYRYLRKSIGLSDIRIAFTDIQTEQSILKRQMIQSIFIAIVSILVFGVLSFFLSEKLTRPVQNSINAQKEFIANASHELKTPLTVILSNTEMLQKSNEISIKDSLTRQRLDHIEDESRRMKQLIEQLLQLAKLDSSTLPVHKEPIDFDFVVCNSVYTYEPILYDIGKSLSFEHKKNIIINGNEQNLRQVIDILLDNAMKYSADRSTISVRLYAVKHIVILAVESTGTPISEKDMEQIFSKFYRGATKTPGYGLGLAIASLIVKEHSGNIWAETDKISKNTFYISLPLIGIK